MKLLTTALGLMAIEFANADVSTPYDCYRERPAAYGRDEGEKITDFYSMTGLNAYSSKLAAITGCIDLRTNRLSGLFTVWGDWNPETNEFDNMQRLNAIGRMSGLVEFDDSSALQEAGLAGLQDGQDVAMQRYWFQEASPDQEQYMMIRKSLGWMSTQEWTAPRQKMFNDADIDNDGQLNYNEAQWFLRYARALDRTVTPYNELDYQLERINNHWFIASLLSSPNDSMSFEDYTQVEKMMEALYSAEKLETTGFVNYWSDSSFDAYKGARPGQYLTHECETLLMDGEDRITNMRVIAGAEGVTGLSIGSSKRTQINFGRASGSALSYEGSEYIRFTEGTDFAGLWGKVDSDGNLNSLGIVERDSVCTQSFLDKLGKDSYSWSATVGSSFDAPQEYPEMYQARVQQLNEGGVVVDNSVASHSHGEEPETALLVITILIWIAIFIMMVVMIVMYCRMKKRDSMISNTRQ